MNELNEKTIETQGYNLHLIRTKKFKTVHIVAKFKTVLSRETITKRALLPYILRQGTKSYPSEQALQLKLDELYGATLSLDVAKKGNHHIFSVRISIANEKFIPKESSLIDEAIDLLNEIIFHPLKDGESFSKEIFEREKRTLRQRIQSIVDQKVAYANMRLIDEMCADEKYRLHMHGYEEDLDTLTAADLFQYYNELIKEDTLDLYVLGDFPEKDIANRLTTSFQRTIRNRQNIKPTDEVVTVKEKPEVYIETQEIQQAKLHIGYRTHVTYGEQSYAPLQVFNGLFGGFPSSKLFMNVREKHSLAYYASSQIESHKGLLFVFSGIDHKDYEQAREIIDLQMDMIRKGEFTDDELNETKDQLIHQILETLDHPQGIIEMLYQQVVANNDLTPEQLIRKIQRVDREAVIQIAKRITEDTVYLLTEESD